MNLDEIKDKTAYFEKFSEKIADMWISNKTFLTIMKKYDINPKDFKELYALKVIKYYIDVLNGVSRIGNCPVMKTLLDDMLEKNMECSDIFLICTQFRKSIISFSFEQNIATLELVEQINYVIDENFSGVLKTYMNQKKGN